MRLRLTWLKLTAYAHRLILAPLRFVFLFLITALPHPYYTKTMAQKHCRRETSLSSTADVATQSTASLPAPDRQPQTKKEKFEDHYKTEETSDADVLGEC